MSSTISTGARVRASGVGRVAGLMTVFCLALIVSCVVAVSVGPTSVPLAEVWTTIVANITGTSTDQVSTATNSIVWLVRVPRVLLGVVVGAGLALAGVVLQALVRNPLAEPYLLGISSGASTGAAAVMLFGFLSGMAFAVPIGAFVGSLLAVITVFAVAAVGSSAVPLRLILAGVAMGGVFSSVTSFMVLANGDSEGARAVMFWTLGSLASAQWAQLLVPAVAVVGSMIFLLSQARALNALVTGDEQALALGVDVARFRLKAIVVASLLTGVLVAVSGVIGFVGLMVPHMVRMAIGADHRRLIVLAAVAGGLFLVWADVAARVLIAPTELPLGIVTSVVGAPVFIYLMRRGARRGGVGR